MSKSICEEQVFKSVFNTYAEHLINFMYYKTGKSFLFTVANNRFLNQVEHEKVVLKFEKRGHSQLSKETPQYLLEKSEFEKALLTAIDELPEGQRAVFLMNRIDGLTYKEIAERLELSEKAIEKRMHKALVALRKISKKL